MMMVMTPHMESSCTADDAYEIFDPTISILAPLPPTTPNSPSHGGNPVIKLNSTSLTIGSESSQQAVLLEVPSYPPLLSALEHPNTRQSSL